MNVLFFHTYKHRLSMIFEIQTEIIMGHLEKGDNVTIVVDYDRIFSSQLWNLMVKAKVYDYRFLFRKMLDLFEPYKELINVVGYRKSELSENMIPLFDNVEVLKKYEYKGINVGRSVASLLISQYRDHVFDTLKCKEAINREMYVASSVLDTMAYYAKVYRPDMVYVFNGRVATYAPVVLFCEKNNIPFRVYEFTSRVDKYHIVDNALPHNIECRNQEMLSLWEEESSLSKKVDIAKRYFEGNRKGESFLEGNFLTYQKEGDIKLDTQKMIISFFNSSIDEFASVPGWENKIYLFKDEVDAIWNICKYYENDATKQFVLRIHPNLAFLDNTQNRELKKLQELKNLVIYSPESSIFSYQLIDISDKVITFGSTVGIEACYFGKPSICLGMSFYENIDVVYIPKDLEGLYRLIEDPNLPPKPKENTYIYGYWWMSFGEPFIYREKGLYTENYYTLKGRKKVVSLFKKITSRDFIRKLVSLLFTMRFYKKLKKVSYRRSLVRELFPWKKI